MYTNSSNIIYLRCEKSLIRQLAEGFTLIEMIIAVVIMMLLLGLTLVGYASYNDKQKVKQAALTLKSDLRMARTNATSGKKPQSCSVTDTFKGYKVSFLSSSYTIVPQCSSGDVVGESVTVNLPITVTFFPVPSSFVYYPLTQGVSSGQSIVLTNGSTSVTLVIDGRSGEVSD